MEAWLPGHVVVEEFFDELPEANIEPEPTRSSRTISALAAFVAFALIVTVTPAVVAVPAAFAIKAAVDEVEAVWEAVPADLPTIPSSLPGFTRVYDAEGNVIAQFYAENRTPVEYEDVSPLLIDAIVAVEDRRFWQHSGADGTSILRALRSNYQAGTTVQGASTLTQQLVENLKLLDAESDEERTAARAQTVAGKVIEAKTAFELEEELSKEEILETYMNVVYFGAGSYGVGAAADRFFGRDVSDLTLPQAALIAGMVREPSGLDPFLYPERAKNRRDTVLVAMRETGAITPKQFEMALEAPLDTSEGNRPTNGCARSAYPFYCEIVRDQLTKDPRLGRTQAQRDAALFQGHLDVHTALDPEVMKVIDASIKEAMDHDNRVATSVVVVQPGTGLVLGVGQNRAWGSEAGQTEIPYALSRFQPGSTFKPVVLATALEQGISANLTMPTASGFEPNNFDFPDGGFSNYGRVDYGEIDAYDATRRSSNVWYARLVTRTGVPEAAQMAKDMGAEDSLNRSSISRRSAAFALGAWEVQPLEMANIYATMAAAGSSCDPVFITDVVDTRTQESLTTQRSSCETVYSQTTAQTLLDVMQQPFAEGGTADDFPLAKGREAIGKTGTTNDHAAAWFAGATPQYSTAVWIGDPRGGQAYPLHHVEAYGKTYERVFGADISGPLWKSVMDGLHVDEPHIPLADVTQAPMSPRTLADLVDPPSVRGMDVLQAVSMLTSHGYEVTVDSEVTTDASPGTVFSSTADGLHVSLTVGAGTDSHLLGEQVLVREGAVVVVHERQGS